MTKPIEWKTDRPADTVTQRKTLRVETREESDTPRPGGWHIVALNDATPADIVAALAAMPLGDRETVLSASWNGIVMRGDYEHMVEERNEATFRAEKAEAEITEVRRVLGVRENAVTASTAAWRMGEITAATFSAENAERERDEARLELRALEWIRNESAFENSLVWWRKGRLWTGDDVEDEVEHPTYASAARALGWEG